MDGSNSALAYGPPPHTGVWGMPGAGGTAGPAWLLLTAHSTVPTVEEAEESPGEQGGGGPSKGLV